MGWPSDEPLAWFGGRLATGLEEVSNDPAALDSAGWWAVVASFEGQFTAARFRDVRDAPLPPGEWDAAQVGEWASSLDQQAYEAAVAHVRDQIAAGEVYQANICRVLSAACPPDADVVGLAHVLAAGNPAPYAGVVRLPRRSCSFGGTATRSAPVRSRARGGCRRTSARRTRPRT